MFTTNPLCLILIIRKNNVKVRDNKLTLIYGVDTVWMVYLHGFSQWANLPSNRKCRDVIER